ncbi:ArnT family glycosyltransferase [Solirubrum puertoriconensis]|uniref:Glycosyltransferase RgtA/B/C/D-like domain-containing protein n=1 Tax=Solirubrum puertoriconensis TaxID=1751427 RepID=A0A9X0L4K9_SOLP1|nr:glycosyltransferase family 39 protein [Solirubrum puertoriconensis]KUG07567.1 hypothetical protein ASU33_14625 [Solirubrum puertoriconensis]
MNAFTRLRSWLPTLTLGFVVLFTVAYFILSHEGLYALDDYFYSRYAHQLLHGNFHLGPDPQGLLHDPLHERWLIFGPVALCYALFGVNIWSTTLWPLLATLLCSVLIWAHYRHRQPLVACGAMLLLGLHYFALNLTNYLYPDNINMLACFAAASALLAGRQMGRNELRWGAGFALLNFAALLCKETVVYYAPFYLSLLTLDVVRRQHGEFWLAAFAIGAVVLITYLGFYQVQTNDALYRVHLIENTNEFLKEGNYLLGNRAALLSRLTLGPVQFLVGTGLGLAVLLAVGAAFAPAQATGRDDRRFWLALAFSTLAFYWFGSTSVSQYNPITLQPRMATPLLPPLCLAAGYGLSDLLRTGRRAMLYALLLLACAAYDRGSAAILYVGWAVVMAALWAAPRLRRLQAGGPAYVSLGLVGIAFVLALRPAHFMRKPSVSGHFPQNRIIRQHLAGQQLGVVFIDDYLIGNYDFYYGYEVPRGLQYRRYWARDSVQLRAAPQAWLLLNRATLSNPELTRKLLRYSADSVLSWYPKRQLIAQDGPVELYQIQQQ